VSGLSASVTVGQKQADAVSLIALDCYEGSAMPNAYVVGQISVKDERKWVEYRNQVPATIAPWGGEVVFRGKKASDFAKENPHTDIVVIRFPSMEAAKTWEASPAYQSIIPLRQEAAEVMLTAYQA
jgi:uncharacterized protein (DUF1330 family)